MTRKGDAATPAQRAALDAGRKARADKLAKSTDEDRAAVRWAKLLDGTITVADLDDEEVSRMRVRGKSGGFAGRGPTVPSHLIQQFQSEQMKRTKTILSKHLLKGAEEIGKILSDPEAKDADKIKAFALLADRILGRNPETVHVKAEDPWAAMLAAGASLGEVRDLSDLAGEGMDTSGT